jgi:hypothetical protein
MVVIVTVDVFVAALDMLMPFDIAVTAPVYTELEGFPRRGRPEGWPRRCVPGCRSRSDDAYGDDTARVEWAYVAGADLNLPTMHSTS